MLLRASASGRRDPWTAARRRSNIRPMLGPASFIYMVAGGFVIGVAALLLIGKYYPGSGAEVLDWKPTRSAELEAELEQGDIQQMLEAQNNRRRLRGAPERTLEDVERDVARNLNEYRDLQQQLESISEEADWRES
jgi:hypothetical protein